MPQEQKHKTSGSGNYFGSFKSKAAQIVHERQTNQRDNKQENQEKKLMEPKSATRTETQNFKRRRFF